MFAPDSPLHASLQHVVACAFASARLGGPPPPSSAAMLSCMLLLYMDEPTTYTALSTLAATHCVGIRPAAQNQWRLKAAEAMVARELPEVSTCPSASSLFHAV